MLYPIRPPTTNNIHRRMKENQGLSVVKAQSLNFLIHNTMPNLMLRKSNGFMGRRRHYPINWSINGGCRYCSQSCFRLPKTEYHVMLTSDNSEGRRTCSYELLEKILKEINIELQIGWGTYWGAGSRNKHWRTCDITNLLYSSKPKSMNFCRRKTCSCIMIIRKNKPTVTIWQGWVAMEWLQTRWASGGLEGVQQVVGQGSWFGEFVG